MIGGGARPEFLIMGIGDVGDGLVGVIATRSLLDASLSYDAEVVRDWGGRVHATYGIHELGARFRDYVLVTGPTYVACLAQLADGDQFRPDDVPSELDGRPVLEAGS